MIVKVSLNYFYFFQFSSQIVFYNYQMGNIQKNKDIKIASLSYSGICLSPFEFISFDKDQEIQTREMEELNEIFINLLAQQVNGDNIFGFNKDIHNEIDIRNNKSILKYELGEIDKKMQKERYTPLYRPDVGINNTRLMTKQQFLTRWDLQFNNNEKYINFSSAVTEKQKEKCKYFDYLIFKTFAEFAYKGVFEKSTSFFEKEAFKIQLQDRDIIDTKINRKKMRLVLEEYENFIQRNYKKSFLDQNMKIQFVKRIFYSYDIVFIQSCSEDLINELKNEKKINIIQSPERESIILIKKGSFKNLYDQKKILTQFSRNTKMNDLISYQSLNFNKVQTEKQSPIVKQLDITIPGMRQNGTAVGFVDNLMLISTHLSSNKKKNQDQTKKLVKALSNIKELYPSIHIIVGLVANSFIANQFQNPMKCFPDQNVEKFSTTKKIRTWLQPQIKKSEEKISERKDFLITDLEMKTSKVETVSGKDPTDVKFLPIAEHPFDHLMLSSTVVVPDI